MEPLILASSSPRRKELLQLLQIPFLVIVSDVDETLPNHISPEEAVTNLALLKASAVSSTNPGSCVIGADTVVVSGSRILGKPADRQEAKEMLLSLSGRKHQVLTGVCIKNHEKEKIFYERTEVTFWDLTEDQIDSYLDTGEPFDKAGAYGIQGFGSLLVKEIHGDYFAVVGLPVSRLSRELQNFL
ncbi:Maf family protein [Peribacillus deserti]|uniref:dTTP/UTP pyrophosphatase n=1 Tax=Peribacillus deserti TaxID=673318 RepID=A0A2N5M777_9BACI|nr:Maf family protein [Peribacillus deserti]PLT30228.1 septum formation inhibitor Maf [Peribacillus deserti]